MPYLNDCEESRHTYENKILLLYMVQKKTLRICRHETRPTIFIYLYTLCVYDMIDFNNMVVMFKIKKNVQ